MNVRRGEFSPVFPLLLLLGLSVLPLTGVAAGNVQSPGSIGDTSPGGQALESNATVNVTEVSVHEPVFRANDTTFVWQSAPNGSNATEHRIDVALSEGGSDDYEVCLGSNACEPVHNRSDPQTVSFANISQPDNRTAVNVTLQRVPDGITVDNATLSIWPIDRDGDLDEDGLSNEREVDVGTSLVLDDTDGDGLIDGRELEEGTDATETDTDGDGLDDAREVDFGTDPTVLDTDRDGVDDAREIELGTDPTEQDTDGDYVSDGREVVLGTDPISDDTDGDGLVDGREVALGSDPTETNSDGDGLDDAREDALGTDPTSDDTDGDGLEDDREVSLGTDPTVTDTDGDGLDDAREVELGSNPTVTDTDGDGLDDAREDALGTDPSKTDTDGDYLADSTERKLGVDPTNGYTPVIYGGAITALVLVCVAAFRIDEGPFASLQPALPTITRWRTTARSQVDASRPPRDPVRAATEDPDESDEPDEPGESGGSTAREVFERHQDALVTDAERTVRMLAAEGGQMKQSAIVDATSWSKAKVSRLLSRMDDEGEITKVSIGRENLICLPDRVPEPARPSDPPAPSSARLVSTATGG